MKQDQQRSPHSSERDSQREPVPNPNFIDILSEKIRAELLKELELSEEKTPNQSAKTAMDTPANKSAGGDSFTKENFLKTTESSLLGQIQSQQFRPKFNSTKYQEMRKVPPPRPAHQLNKAQAVALQYFKSHGFELAANFSIKDLKGAFRKIALKIHPDQGGESIEFQTLLFQRKALEELFTPLPEAK